MIPRQRLKIRLFFDLQAARQAGWDAQRRLDLITGDRLQNEISGAQAQLVLAESNLESATHNYNEFKDEPEDNTTRAFYQVQLTEAQRAFNDAEQHLDDLQGEGYTFVLQQAQDALETAKSQRELSEEHFFDVSQGPDANALEVANARIYAERLT